MHLRRPPRLSTFDYKGRHRYFFTMCTLGRRQLFADAAVVDMVRWQILRTVAERGFAVLAYTFMPDHLHALVEGLTEVADFRNFCSLMRRRCSSACWPVVKSSLWQDGYHERVLRGTDGTQEVIDYILANPVRAGLVERAVDYPHSWSITL